MSTLLDTIASADAPPGTREEAADALLVVHPSGDFGYDPYKGPAENAKALRGWNDWWHAQGGKLSAP